MTGTFLVGAWRLMSYESRARDGEVEYPLGLGATGYIMYTADGHMSVAMMSADRTNYASSDLREGTVEEKLAAAETYVSYCGSFELQGDVVVHHVEVAFLPNRVGTSQERTFKVSGDTLRLSTPPMLIAGVEQTGHLVWKRAKERRPESPG
jgi:hypothetical protein